MSMAHDHVEADAARILQPSEKGEAAAAVGSAAAPGHLSPAGVLGMQQAAGNRGTRAAVGGLARGASVQRMFGLPFGGGDPTMGSMMGGMGNPAAMMGGMANQFGGGALGYGQQQGMGALGGLGLPPQLMGMAGQGMGMVGGMAGNYMGQGISQGMGAMGGVPGMGAGSPLGMLGGLGSMLGGLF
jgi:hypothetical protein